MGKALDNMLQQWNISPHVKTIYLNKNEHTCGKSCGKQENL